jgi:NAD(P)-dependent dehydrogenase (short-subunit alcohol dehydrogenase family)
VTGASRGGGKGIALVLDEEGATFWDEHWAQAAANE